MLRLSTEISSVSAARRHVVGFLVVMHCDPRIGACNINSQVRALTGPCRQRRIYLHRIAVWAQEAANCQGGQGSHCASTDQVAAAGGLVCESWGNSALYEFIERTVSTVCVGVFKVYWGHCFQELAKMAEEFKNLSSHSGLQSHCADLLGGVRPLPGPCKSSTMVVRCMRAKWCDPRFYLLAKKSAETSFNR